MVIHKVSVHGTHPDATYLDHGYRPREYSIDSVYSALCPFRFLNIKSEVRM